MIIECSSCGKTIGETPPYGGPLDHWSNQTIHEVCDQCKRDAVKYDGYELAPDHHTEPCETLGHSDFNQ